MLLDHNIIWWENPGDRKCGRNTWKLFLWAISIMILWQEAWECGEVMCSGATLWSFQQQVASSPACVLNVLLDYSPPAQNCSDLLTLSIFQTFDLLSFLQFCFREHSWNNYVNVIWMHFHCHVHLQLPYDVIFSECQQNVNQMCRAQNATAGISLTAIMIWKVLEARHEVNGAIFSPKNMTEVKELEVCMCVRV